MNDSVKRISLDIHSTSSRETVNAKRGDTGRKIYISLVDGGIPYTISEDCYAVFTAKKPDKNVVYNDCTIENNTIIYEVTEQTVAVEGRVNCEIKLYGADNKLITSPCFTILVYGTVYNEGDEIESEKEVAALTQLVGEAKQATDNANDAADEANRVAKELQDARDNGEFTGPSITILGSYDTEAELIAAHPTGELGEYYLVGMDLYVWSAKENRWLNVGSIQGTNGYAPAITIASEDELAAVLRDVHQSMSDGYAKTFRMSVTVANLSIGGGIWFVTVYRSTTKYGFAEAVRYGGSGGLIYTNSLQEGAWSGWINISPSQFVPTTGGTISGDVSIKGNLKLQKADNGYGMVYKNHSATSDFGVQVNDYAKNGDYVSLQLLAKTQEVNLLTSVSGVAGKLQVLHSGNYTSYAAPTGFGLGTMGKTCSDCNTALKSGWYSLSGESCLNAPPSYANMKYGVMLVSNRFDSYIAQMIFYQKLITIRYSVDGGKTWAEWEHLNPPMVVDTEYRTTDRYKEFAVYKKVDTNGNILWRRDGESQWHLLSSADYVATATVE